MSTIGFGFREVLPDQHFSGKWTDIDVTLGESRTTFQGRKFSDFAGGFTYKPESNTKQIVQNRSIYWRTLNDTVELVEVSMDYNLYDNQVRYIFRDSPIVGPVSIQETDTHIILLIATVNTLNRIVFTHPKLLVQGDDMKFMKNNNQPSIFHQIMQKPIASMKSFNIYDHSINMPVPTCASSFVITHTEECVFALSFENGSVNIYKISRDDLLTSFDLRSANIFSRFISGFTPTILKSQNVSTHASIGLSFFTIQVDKYERSLFLLTLTMNGHLKLWKYINQNAWEIVHDSIVHTKFVTNHTDCGMILRKGIVEDKNDLPTFSIFIPGEGFKIYQIVKNTRPTTQQIIMDQYMPLEIQSIEFKEKDLMDFTLTPDFLFLLVSNPDEDTEWDLKSYKLSDSLNSRFNLALLEPTPYTEIEIFPPTVDPKDFYFDLIFNKCSFSAQSIYLALSMFQSSSSFKKNEVDWEQTKIYAMNVIDTEIAIVTSVSDSLLTDDEYFELNHKYWHNFYTSCVEYHIHTLKPLGIFYDTNTQLLCIVKKSRISFIRPTDILETFFYFPHCVQISEHPDSSSSGDDRFTHFASLLRYLEIMDAIESSLTENLRNKIEKRLLLNHTQLEVVCNEVVNKLIQTDSEVDRRHFIPTISSKLRDLGEIGDIAMGIALNIISNWEQELDNLDGGIADVDERQNVTEFFMGSHLGVNLAYKTFKQLIQHRFMIARNTMLLQAIIKGYFIQNTEHGNIPGITLTEKRDANFATCQYFGLSKLLDRYGEIIPDFVLEKGTKIANYLGLSTTDPLIQGKLTEFWPMRVVEMFCHSNLGGLAIRSRISSLKGSVLLSYVDSLGKAIWPNDESATYHPFEEFLISTCQYSSLRQYTNDMGKYFCRTEPSLKKFFNGLVELCTGNSEDRALAHFLSVNVYNAWNDPYFSTRIIKTQENSGKNEELSYYHKIITFYQIFEHTSGVQVLAEEAMKVCRDDERAMTTMCALAFKSALELCDYEEAFNYILKMPTSVNEGGYESGEKISSLRTFISQLLSMGEIEILIGLDLSQNFSLEPEVIMRDSVESILDGQAKLSDPFNPFGVYQMLYLYHLSQQNYLKAASTMYSRVIRLGEEKGGYEALKNQHDDYLDILNCLFLINEDGFKKVGESDNKNLPEPTIVLDGSYIHKPGLLKAIGPKTYSDIQKECHVVAAILKLNGKINYEPIKIEDFRNKAELLVETLSYEYYFDKAISLAKMWKLSFVPIFQSMANVCTNLMHGVLPASGDQLDYIRNNDLSELPNSNQTVAEKAFLLLQKYLIDIERPRNTFYHKQIALHLLAYNVPLPQWFIDFYKKKDATQLIRCFMRYGDWYEATDTVTKMIEVTLGRRRSEEFDPSIREMTPFESDPYLPIDLINTLANEIHDEAEKYPQYFEMIETLKCYARDYDIRFTETRNERIHMFQNTLHIYGGVYTEAN